MIKVSNIPEGFHYSQKHEWVKEEDGLLLVGITDFAQNSLGDIVYVDLNEVDTEFENEDSIGTIESVKAAEDIYAPLSGKIAEINESLKDNPEKINSDPYANWLLKIKDFNSDDINNLMDTNAYQKFTADQE